MLIGPTLTLILPRISSPSTESRVAPGMQGATLSTSSSTSHARSLGTGTMNECSSSILLSSRCRCQCSAGQYLREVAPVIGRTMQVCRWFRPICRAFRGRGERGAVGRRPRGGCLSGGGPDRYGSHIRQPDPGLGRVPVRSPGQSGHADDRPSLRGSVELLVTIAPVRAKLWHPYPCEDLVGRQSGGEVVHEEVRRRDLPGASRARGKQGAA